MNPSNPQQTTVSPTTSAGDGDESPLRPPAPGHEPSPIDLAEQSVAGEEDPGAAYGDEPMQPACGAAAAAAAPAASGPAVLSAVEAHVRR